MKNLIKLNVGGQIFETRRDTLAKMPMLQKLVDFPGTIQPAFVDRDPEIFRIILGLARGWPLSLLDKLPAFQRQAVQVDADYFQMDIVDLLGNFTFHLRQSNDTALITNAGTAYTTGSLHIPNCVLGSTQIPRVGRSCWEVTIIEKEAFCWDYVGVAQPTVDCDQNLNGPGAWSWTSDSRTSWICCEGDYGLKDLLPAFTTGMVIGIDVDMDRGSLSFWSDGRFIAQVDVNLRGYDLFPAFSVEGTTIMQVRSGLPPFELAGPRHR